MLCTFPLHLHVNLSITLNVLRTWTSGDSQIRLFAFSCQQAALAADVCGNLECCFAVWRMEISSHTHTLLLGYLNIYALMLFMCKSFGLTVEKYPNVWQTTKKLRKIYKKAGWERIQNSHKFTWQSADLHSLTFVITFQSNLLLLKSLSSARDSSYNLRCST